MIKKENMVVGTIVVVNKNCELGEMLLMKSVGDFFRGGEVAVKGDQLEVLTPPKTYYPNREQRINCCKVHNLTTGTKGFIYWTYMRTHCDQVFTITTNPIPDVI